MKKIIQFLIIIILLAVIALIIIVVFNPMNSRDKIISNVLNSYLSNNISSYDSLPSDAPIFEDRGFDNPLLNDAQEKTLYEFGVDTSKLPTEITNDMQGCFINKLGEDRAKEIAGGAVPTSVEIYKAKDCLGE